MEADTPNQIIGVLAHETGHIAGGHLSRIREQLAAASTQAILAMILGVGAMVAGARSGNSGMSNAGAAIMQGPQAAIQNSLFGYIRAQEDQADRAAVKFLTATGQSAKGMAETFKRLADQTMYQTRGMNPYMQSHPLPSERVAALQGIARQSPYWDKKDSPAMQARHDLARAKLYGFMDRPDGVARRYQPHDNSLPARYARAISTYRFGNPRAAIAQIDALIQAQPQNPYFYELKGQALLESGKPAEAIAPLRHAAQLAPNPALIQIMLGQALIATHDRGRLDEAINAAAGGRHPRAGIARRLQPARHGLRPEERPRRAPTSRPRRPPSCAATSRPRARSPARAKTRFPVGSPGWVKADDIVSYKPPQSARRM